MKKIIMCDDLEKKIRDMHKDNRETLDRSEEYRAGFEEALNQVHLWTTFYDLRKMKTKKGFL